MAFITSLFLSALLLNSSVIQVDSVGYSQTAAQKTFDHEIEFFIDKITAVEGFELKYITALNNEQAVEIKFESGIHFATGECELDDGSKDALVKIAGILKAKPAIKISIIGHTDNFGTLDLNQILSEKRAITVAGYLIAQKVKEGQIQEIAGKNFTEPVANNFTANGRAANRRVEMSFVLFPGSRSSVAVQSDSLKTNIKSASVTETVEQVENIPVESNDEGLELDGLLVDETKTKSGKDFYDMFYTAWEAPAGAKNFTITVSEKPFRLSSTLIVISVNENTVYEAVLQPRLEIIESQSGEAIYMTQDYLANYEEIMRQINGDDLTGSGIY